MSDDLTLQGRLFQTDDAACAQKKDKEWKYQKKSVAGVLVCKLSEVQSYRQERSS